MGEGSLKTLLIRPDYARQFRCIGPECEDSCCTGWSVFFDQRTCEKYRTIRAGPLRELIDAKLTILPPNADGSPPAQFARVEMAADKVCPFLNAEKLCQIQSEHGEEFLSVTCATYPRVVHKIDGVEERSLALSCPEAARLVLLTPDLLSTGEGLAMSLDDLGDEIAGAELNGAGKATGQAALLPYFWPIRALAIGLLAERRYELWQRLFLLGAFARRMDALARGELDRDFFAVMGDFCQAVDSGTLREAMETIPADPGMQLDMVLRLAGMQLPRSHVGQRFLDAVEVFKQGIGNGPGATMQTLMARYAEAHDRVYEPFFHARPHILENLLANAVFRALFPFGHKDGSAQAAPKMHREFAMLATYFALMKGLLIGVAGFYGESFCEEHVIQTVQSVSKHFEHHPQFLNEAHALLVANKMDDLRGLTMLVRN